MRCIFREQTKLDTIFIVHYGDKLGPWIAEFVIWGGMRMKITRVKINNYRSVGSEQNCLHVEPKVTALIGKNESGKSNILEAVKPCPL